MWSNSTVWAQEKKQIEFQLPLGTSSTQILLALGKYLSRKIRQHFLGALNSASVHPRLTVCKIMLSPISRILPLILSKKNPCSWFIQVWWPFIQGLFPDFSRTFNNVQGVRFHRHDYHIFSTDHCKIHFHMIQNRMRIMSLAVHLQFYCCLSFFMCDFNADSPMFEMSIIRSQYLQKAFFTQPARCLENTNSEYCRL